MIWPGISQLRGKSGRYKYKESKNKRWIKDHDHLWKNVACSGCEDILIDKLNEKAAADGANVVTEEEADAAFDECLKSHG